MNIDYRRLLTSFLAKHDITLISEVDNLLKKYRGKEPKLMLILAKKYDTSNPLNRVFLSCVTDEHLKDYVALTTLFLAIYYPQNLQEAAKLCDRNKGNEEKLFKKLSSNFMAINPLKMDRTTTTTCKTGEEMMMYSPPINYRDVLITFYTTHDADKVEEVDDILSKCIGKEAILFSVLALKYSTTNALNAVFEERMMNGASEESTSPVKDHLSLLQLYLSVFHPSCAFDAKTMLLKYQGAEEELFLKLSTKFQACNALEVWKAGSYGKLVKDQEETTMTTSDIAKETVGSTGGSSGSSEDTKSPLRSRPPIRRSARIHAVLHSPTVTP